jgi:hypothetical protein
VHENSTAFLALFSKTLGFVRLAVLQIDDYEFRCSVLITRLVWPAQVSRLAILFSEEGQVAMARPLEEIARRDRRWFRAHPERQYRCRSPAPGELDRYGSGHCLIIAIRHIGRGHLAYQPVILEGQLANDEKSAGILFALAAKHPEPIPTVGEREVRRWRFVVESRRPPARPQ